MYKRQGIQRVRLVNDFVANGYGLLTLDHEKECVCLQRAPHVAGAPIACIGAGTGLGECFSTATEVGKEYDTYASEGGHAEFAPRNDLETELLTFLKKKFAQRNRVSVERVVSGTGLANVYEFLSTKYKSKVIKAVHDEFLAAAGLKKKTVLNADGEYFDEAKEAGSWQDAWAQRAAKASKMSGDDILNAARGAGNVDASLPESAKARRRRAVAACRTDAVRERMAAGTAAECLERALAGETDFVLGKS